MTARLARNFLPAPVIDLTIIRKARLVRPFESPNSNQAYRLTVLANCNVVLLRRVAIFANLHYDLMANLTTRRRNSGAYDKIDN